jgi:hypothetical protein
MSSIRLTKKMEIYFLGAYWGDRKESVEECANRVVECLSAIPKCDEAFSRWYLTGRSRKEALEGEFLVTREAVKQQLLKGRNRRDVGGEVIENLGFSLNLWNGGKDSQDVRFSIQCGTYAANPNLCNSCLLNLPSEGLPRERVLRVDALLCLMGAVVAGFDPD